MNLSTLCAFLAPSTPPRLSYSALEIQVLNASPESGQLQLHGRLRPRDWS